MCDSNRRARSTAFVNEAEQLITERVERALHRANQPWLLEELVASVGNGFHQVYRGLHPTRRERALLYLYHPAASREKKPELLARREFTILQCWQRSRHVPKLLDPYRELASEGGKLCYFSLVDTLAVAVGEKAGDETWSLSERLGYAIRTLQALQQFHKPPDARLQQLIHRNINPKSLRVRHDNSPLFTDFRLGRLSGSQTLGVAEMDFGENTPFVAPEVLDADLHSADSRSDLFAVSKTVALLFAGSSFLQQEIREVLQAAAVTAPAQRTTLAEMIRSLESLHRSVAKRTQERSAADGDEPVDPKYWDEETIIPFGGSYYRPLQRLGGGGIGLTFKVVEVERESGEEYGIYVAKVIGQAQDGTAALEAYRRVRAHATNHPNLSVIYEKAQKWSAKEPVALMKWIEGRPLSDHLGALPALAEKLGEESIEKLALHWLLPLCNALWILHRVKLVHGDVTPANIILSEQGPILTDYDTVADEGAVARARTPLYCSPEVQSGGTLHPSDDIYSLAASFFHLCYGREPFRYAEETRKEYGLHWPVDQRDPFHALRPFLTKATAPHREERFPDAFAAINFLNDLSAPEGAAANRQRDQRPATLLSQKNPWLKSLLSTYPGSKWGNIETRGLDSLFALSTYVETELDRTIRREVEQAKVHLIILFGNAGDGKTAFLQYLAKGLGVEAFDSSQRVLHHRLRDGRELMINLDGSASWKGRSSHELLDEILGPFHAPDYPKNRLHIVAINSGKLLEWLESQPAESHLTRQLRTILLDQAAALDPAFRLIDLNQRSLVGGVDQSRRTIRTDFFTTLLDKMLGDQRDEWAVCPTCSAHHRCGAWRSVQALRDPKTGHTVRERLVAAFQACHQRGEIHITARELRAALSYILFGVEYCDELHDHPELNPSSIGDQAFHAESYLRQGELLGELARLDPALENDPWVDRELLKTIPLRENYRTLAKLRRDAYCNGSHGGRVPLAQGAHITRFRQVALMDEAQRQALCRELCEGIARLEELPYKAFGVVREHGVALRIAPRTPVESAFWVIKPWQRFRLHLPQPTLVAGLEFLPLHLELRYTFGEASAEAAGTVESLRINLELFHLLLELRSGTQLSGSGEEGIFANLALFRQRLAQEHFAELYAWHPAEENHIYRISVEYQGGKRRLTKRLVESR